MSQLRIAMKKRLSILLAAAFLAPTLSAQQIKPFQDGDRAVFLGNSITDGGHYHSYVWLYYMTRFPEMNLRVYNAGVGGDTAFDMNKRLDADALDKRPTALMVTFGMNDTGYREYNEPEAAEFGEARYRKCLDYYRSLEKRLQGLQNTRVVLMGSSPYDEEAELPKNKALRGKNAVMERVIAFQKASAEANGWEFIDFNAPMTVLNRAGQKNDPVFTLCGRDRIHPDNDGHMVMAYLFLKAQGFAGKEVAHVKIDAARAKIVDTGNCDATGLAIGRTGLSFDYLAYALPYPMDAEARGWEMTRSQSLADGIVPFIDEMNRETLTVSGLKGNYKLLIDGVEIAALTGNGLAAGVNLAVMPRTPQYRQAQAVMFLNEERWTTERKFRDYSWIQFNFFQKRGLLFADNAEALDALDRERANDGWLRMHWDNYSQMMHAEVRSARQAEIDSLVEKIYRINKPIIRKITLKKV
jgi:lysophospholipase L1-like esterase